LRIALTLFANNVLQRNAWKIISKMKDNSIVNVDSLSADKRSSKVLGMKNYLNWIKD